MELLLNSYSNDTISVPNINGNEWKYVKDYLDAGWISLFGVYVSEYENTIHNFTGLKYE